MNWTEEIPSLTIELLDNGNLRLEDKNYSESAIVDVHPSQVRIMAERLGLVREMSAAHADALRTVATLKRRLRVLAERCQFIGHYLAECSDHAHADLSYEQQFAEATADIAHEFVADLDHKKVEPSSTFSNQAAKPDTWCPVAPVESGSTPATQFEMEV